MSCVNVLTGATADKGAARTKVSSWLMQSRS
jgi:hypothetical protein